MNALKIEDRNNIHSRHIFMARLKNYLNDTTSLSEPPYFTKVMFCSNI